MRDILDIVELRIMSPENSPPLVGGVRGGGEKNIRYRISILPPSPDLSRQGEEYILELGSTSLGRTSILRFSRFFVGWHFICHLLRVQKTG